jgi:uncharacterized protein YcfL
MKKIYLLPLFLLIGCKSYLINKALEKVGVYEENVEIKIISNNDKKIIFIPMKHIATELFYDNVKTKIDSLEKYDYYFYYELVNGVKDSITTKKFRKISGIPENKKGYLETLDSVLKGIKYKKKLVNQPKDQMELGLNINKSKNIDVTMQEIIKHYESLNGEIILEKCDLDTPPYSVTKCKNKNIDKKKLEKSILNFRNEHIIKEINSDSRKNIAIVYGAAHFDGVLKLLQEKDSTWVEIK